jgi:hypothetical protein
MSLTGDALALAVMDDDGFGCAITSAPVTLARLTAYLDAKHAYEDMVDAQGPAHNPGDPWPASVKAAGAHVHELKLAGGYAGPDGPWCCREYGYLHEPAFSLPGCRWLSSTTTDTAPPAWRWPAGKTFGELSPAERALETRQAARQLQAELERAAPAIAEIMNTTKEGE